MASMGAPRRSLTALFKQGMNEIPEVVGSTGLAIVGLCLGAIGLYRYQKNDGANKKYKMTYVIMRPDDPRVAKVHKD